LAFNENDESGSRVDAEAFRQCHIALHACGGGVTRIG
jgi:hypothetical protein